MSQERKQTFKDSFQESLEKEKKNKAGKENCYAVYKFLLSEKGWNKLIRTDYDDSYFAKCYQAQGVDVFLTKENWKGHPTDFMYIDEKLHNSNPVFYFEYEKKSGNAGWSVDDKALTTLIFYTIGDDDLYIIKFDLLREYLLKNEGRLMYFYKHESIEYDKYNNRKKGNRCIKIPISKAIEDFKTDDGQKIIWKVDTKFLEHWKQVKEKTTDAKEIS